jgi:hypothetical protein
MTDTSSATANTWNISNGKTAYTASGEVTGTGWFPTYMKYPGTEAHYTNTKNPATTPGWTFFCRFKIGSTLTTNQLIFSLWPTASNNAKIWVFVHASNDATHPNILAAYARNTSGANILSVFSIDDIEPKKYYSFFCSYKHAAPAANTFRLHDGTSWQTDDTGATGRVVTSGTVNGAQTWVDVGTIINYGSGVLMSADSEIGYLCYHDSKVQTNYTDFFQSDGQPIDIDSVNWTDFGGYSYRPHIFSVTGDVANDNRGQWNTGWTETGNLYVGGGD